MNSLFKTGRSCNIKLTWTCISKIYTSKFNLKNKFLIRKPYSYIQLCKISSTGCMGSLKSHTCGELTLKHEGSEVTLRGFLQYQRMGKFCVLRDSFGITQIIINNDEISSVLKETSYESYIEVSGEVKLRPQDQINKEMKTGEIEVYAKEFTVLNKAKKDIPFLIRNHNMPIESLALKHRYLDLRHQYLQDNLRFRSKLGKKIRDYLQDEEGFIEITTPTLSANTPGGAKEFLVPSQHKDKFYSLVQSPQIYKQLAMIGGFEKYFQFAICYRDEGGKPDRQPEFMQLDLEMADTTISEIESVIEKLILRSWPENYSPLVTPFPSISYNKAMEDYGKDKPDTRFEWKLRDVTSIFSESEAQIFVNNLKGEGKVAKAFVIPGGGKYIKNSHQKNWNSIAEKEVNLPGVILFHVKDNIVLKGPAIKAITQEQSESLVSLLKAEPGDVIVMAVGHKSKVLKLLGKLRIYGAEVLESEGVVVREPNLFNFLWVNDFPLFELSEETDQLVSCHHPFTAPHPDHIQLLQENPLQVKSQHYDLVLNGNEIAGGSIRIHDAELQKTVLDILGIEHTKMEFLLGALSCGAPPHGGIALGFDRYISILCGCKSIREVMAFPKTGEGKCLMSGTPEQVTQQIKKLYHLS